MADRNIQGSKQSFKPITIKAEDYFATKADLQQVDRDLNAKIDKVEANLNAKIDKVEAKIDKAEANLEAKIDKVEANLNAKIDGIRLTFTVITATQAGIFAILAVMLAKMLGAF